MTLIKTSLPPFPAQGTLDRWANPQDLMGTVIRWSAYNKEDPPRVRQQNNLAHTYAITQLARQFCAWMKASIWASHYESFDCLLLLSAITHHDEGEGYTQVDHPKFRKTDEHDLHEYEEMCKVWQDLPEYVRRSEKESFLLQFCIKSPQCFPAEAREIMDRLKNNRRNEALAFNCLECFDYVLYAIEQYQKHDNEMIMVQVVRDQIATLDQLCTDFIPFTLFWSPPVRGWCYEMLQTYEGRFTGPRGVPE